MAIVAGVLQLVGAYRMHQFQADVKSVTRAPHPSAT
jgi:hypothetical protein